LKVYVKNAGGEWRRLEDPGKYEIRANDRILVTYGAETEAEIRDQQEAVTNFSSQL
jgi:hypothetical protein